MKSNQKKQSILLVDDNKGFSQRLSTLLNEMDCVSEVSTAGNYDEAIRSIDHTTYDIVLMDINMPGKSGMILLRKVKEMGVDSEVVMLSNYAGAAYRQECIRLGASHFLDKTTDIEKVPLIIHSFCSGIFNTL